MKEKIARISPVFIITASLFADFYSDIYDSINLEITGKKITHNKLKDAIIKVNKKREVLQKLYDTRKANPPPISGVVPKDAPRILISGTPMTLPNWKLHDIIEKSGAVVVTEESCTGTRYFSDLVEENSVSTRC